MYMQVLTAFLFFAIMLVCNVPVFDWLMQYIA